MQSVTVRETELGNGAWHRRDGRIEQMPNRACRQQHQLLQAGITRQATAKWPKATCSGLRAGGSRWTDESGLGVVYSGSQPTGGASHGAHDVGDGIYLAALSGVG